jgi:phage shock protein PspC (stress-responsive transcriptional regulator)
MNKTLTINISGIIFHIEEDAYEKLSKYLSTIKGYFNSSEGREEIVSDIEARIAEMLQGRVSPVKQVIVMDDVEHVITVMGKPEEFAGDEAGAEKEQSEESYTQASGAGRKRVFRDPDDKLLGGVCSGIGHYFGIQPVWLRLALAISFFVFGFGFLIYILLWIIIPQAKTTAEKLEMRGEAVNVNSIHRTFTDEMDDLKKRMKEFKENASGMGTKENKEKIKRGAGRVGEFIEEFFGMLGKVIVKFFGGISILIGIGLLIALLASTFGFHSRNIHFGINSGNLNTSPKEFLHLFFNNSQLTSYSFISLLLLLGVPCLMLIYGGIRVLFGLGKRNRLVGGVASLLWFGGLFLGIYTFYQISGDFASESKNKRSVAVKIPSNTLYVRMENSGKQDDDMDEKPHHHTWEMFSIHDHQAFGYYPNMDIKPSMTDSFEVCIISSAKGSTSKEALNRARNIQYSYSMKDSVLVLDPAFSFNLDDKWRNQNIRILIKVPKNKMIHLSRNLRPLIYKSDISNLQETEDTEMLGRKWIMREEGLDCVDCSGLDMIHQKPESPQVPQPPQPPLKKA